MKIGIIGAMEEEVRLLKETIGEFQEWQEGGASFYSGKIGEHEVIVVQSGIGKVLAAVTTTLLISHYNVEVVINTGSAGGIGENLQIGDLIIADKVAYQDVDVTAFNYEFGQMAGMPLYYESARDLVRIAQSAAQEVHYHVQTGLIVSGDTFVHTKEQTDKIRQHFPRALANEMEATAIAQVAYQFQIPFVVIRVLSDTADENADQDFDSFIKEAGRKSAEFVAALVKKI